MLKLRSFQGLCPLDPLQGLGLWTPSFRGFKASHSSVKSHRNLLHLDPGGGGGTRMVRGGIRLVHGHTKNTLITYFSGMKINPKYACLHAFFLICPSCPFQNLSIWPKTPYCTYCPFSLYTTHSTSLIDAWPLLHTLCWRYRALTSSS